MAADIPELIVADAVAWRRWLGEHQTAQTGVWLVPAKKGVTGPTSFTDAHALDEVLCHGWIEGRMHPAGEAEVVRAEGDGRWEAAYAGQASKKRTLRG